MNDTQTVYTATTSPFPLAAVSISSTAGAVMVEHQVGPLWISLGVVPANAICVFEGPHAAVRVKAQVASSTGTYSNRAPTDVATDPDHVVGTGTMSFGTTPVAVFLAPGSLDRTIFVTCTSGEVKLRTTSGGSDLLTISAGRFDVYRAQASAYWLVGTGAAAFTVLDHASAGTWMALPQAHWSDQFSPLFTDRDGSLTEGDPDAPDDSGEPVVSRSVWDEDNEEYDTVSYVDNEALVMFTPSTSAATIEELFEEVGVEIDSAWFAPNAGDPSIHMSWFHIRIDSESEYYDELPDLLDYLNGLECVDGAGYNDVGDACGYKAGNPDEFFGYYTSENRTFANFEWEAQNELLWLHAMEAWDDQSGPPGQNTTHDTGAGIGVVLIDSGIDIISGGAFDAHPDLEEKVYKKTFTSGGTSFRMGLAKENKKLQVLHIDTHTNAFSLPTTKKEFAHGTCIAGIICADTFSDDDGGQEPDDQRAEGLAGCGPDLTVFPAKAHWKTRANGIDGGPTAGSVVAIIKALQTLVKTSGNGQTHPDLRVVTVAHAWAVAPEGMKNAIKKDIDTNQRVYVTAAGDTGTEKKMYPAFWDGDVSGLLGVTAADNDAGTDWGQEGTDFRRSESTFWNGGKNSASTTPSHYSVSGYWHSLTTDYRGEDGYSSGAQMSGTNFESEDYTDFYGTSAAAAHVSALAGLMYSRAKKTGLLDGIGNDVTPSSIAQSIRDNLKSGPLHLQGQSGSKKVPGVVHFVNAKDDL